jgi:hypothetical protein
VSDKLTPEEDAELRRLHYFERFGCELAPKVRAVKGQIRSRDKRAVIREPEDAATLGSEARARVAQDGVGMARRSR